MRRVGAALGILQGHQGGAMRPRLRFGLVERSGSELSAPVVHPFQGVHLKLVPLHLKPELKIAQAWAQDSSSLSSSPI